MTRQRLYEIMRFCLVGGASFLVDYGLLYICTEWLGIYYFYSAGISFCVSVLFNYWLCITYVFVEAGRQTKSQAVLFIGASLVGLGINQVCMWYFVEIVGIYYMLAKIFATAIVTVWNYIMKRRVVQVQGAVKYDL